MTVATLLANIFLQTLCKVYICNFYSVPCHFCINVRYVSFLQFEYFADSKNCRFRLSSDKAKIWLIPKSIIGATPLIKIICRSEHGRTFYQVRDRSSTTKFHDKLKVEKHTLLLPSYFSSHYKPWYPRYIFKLYETKTPMLIVNYIAISI